jgi:hypothetical protein
VIALLCYLIACILFLLAAFNVPSRPNLIAAGLFFAVLPHLISAFLDVGARV